MTVAKIRFRGGTESDVEAKYKKWAHDNAETVHVVKKHPVEQYRARGTGFEHLKIEGSDAFSVLVEYEHIAILPPVTFP